VRKSQGETNDTDKLSSPVVVAQPGRPYFVSRRSSSKLALMATMIVLSDIRAAPMAGLRRIPQG
jgi:hypothetical protein